jgi:hypothetical protein
MAELMAHLASRSASESEAEAMVGAATALTISPRNQVRLRRLIPHLVRGAALLTRILRLRRRTRPAVRVVPFVVKRTTRILSRAASKGRPLSRRLAGRVMASQTRRVLGSRRASGHAIKRSIRKARSFASRATRLSRLAPPGSLRLRKLRRLRRLRRHPRY